MNVCLSLQDLLDLSQPQIAEMQRIAALLPRSEIPCAPEKLVQQVRLVEGSLRQTYGAAAAIARRTSELRDVAEVWQSMSTYCDSILHSLRLWKDRFPDAAPSQLYDLVLDYKLACEKRLQGVREELAWEPADSPRGLFPELI